MCLKIDIISNYSKNVKIHGFLKERRDTWGRERGANGGLIILQLCSSADSVVQSENFLP